MIETDGLWKIERAAKFVGVHPNTLRNWEKEGVIKPYRIGRRKDRLYAKWMLSRLLTTETK